MKKCLTFAVLLFLIAVVSIGCGPKRPEGLPDLYPTEITINCNGAPLAGAYVTVMNAEAPISFAIGGKTNEMGVAAMQVQIAEGDFMGAPEGNLSVLVSKTTIIKDPGGNSDLDFGAELVDPVYLDAKNTPLKIEVTKGTNAATFDVKPNEKYIDQLK